MRIHDDDDDNGHDDRDDDDADDDYGDGLVLAGREWVIKHGG